MIQNPLDKIVDSLKRYHNVTGRLISFSITGTGYHLTEFDKDANVIKSFSSENFNTIIDVLLKYWII